MGRFVADPESAQGRCGVDRSANRWRTPIAAPRAQYRAPFRCAGGARGLGRAGHQPGARRGGDDAEAEREPPLQGGQVRRGAAVLQQGRGRELSRAATQHAAPTSNRCSGASSENPSQDAYLIRCVSWWASRDLRNAGVVKRRASRRTPGPCLTTPLPSRLSRDLTLKVAGVPNPSQTWWRRPALAEFGPALVDVAGLLDECRFPRRKVSGRNCSRGTCDTNCAVHFEFSRAPPPTLNAALGGVQRRMLAAMMRSPRRLREEVAPFLRRRARAPRGGARRVERAERLQGCRVACPRLATPGSLAAGGSTDTCSRLGPVAVR